MTIYLIIEKNRFQQLSTVCAHRNKITAEKEVAELQKKVKNCQYWIEETILKARF